MPLYKHGVNPRFRKLKMDIAHAGGFYPTMKAGSRVLVTDACNQPDWRKKGSVYLEQPGCGCAILIHLNKPEDQGFINP